MKNSKNIPTENDIAKLEKRSQTFENCILSYLKWQIRTLKTLGLMPFYRKREPYRITAPTKHSQWLYKAMNFTKVVFVLLHIRVLLSSEVLSLIFIKSKTDGISDLLDSSICMFSSITISWMCVWNGKHLIKILNSLLKIDQLLTQFPESPAQRKSDFNRFNIYLCMVFGYIVFLMIVHCRRFFESFSIYIFLYATLYEMENAASCAFIVFVSSLLYLLTDRFQFLHQLMAQYNTRILQKTEYQRASVVITGNYSRNSVTHSRANLHLFAKNSKFFYALHNDLLDIFKLVNSYAGVSLLAFILYACYGLLSCTYIISLVDWRNDVVLYEFTWIASWIPLYLGMLILLANNCDAVTKEANKTSLIISRIYRKEEEYQDTIDKFLIKSIKQDIRITAYGFFAIDHSSLFKIFSVASSYLIILIQFKLLENTKSQK